MLVAVRDDGIKVQFNWDDKVVFIDGSKGTCKHPLSRGAFAKMVTSFVPPDSGIKLLRPPRNKYVLRIIAVLPS